VQLFHFCFQQISNSAKKLEESTSNDLLSSNLIGNISYLDDCNSIVPAQI